jgi:hypothetical protein
MVHCFPKFRYLPPYPSNPGVFFLLSYGQLCLMRSQPKRAVQFYTKAIQSQSQYRNLHHVSFWEIAISQLALWDIPASLECWQVMADEATVGTYSLSLPSVFFSA